MNPVSQILHHFTFTPKHSGERFLTANAIMKVEENKGLLPRRPHNSWPEMRALSRAVVNGLLRRPGEISFIEIKKAAKFCHYGNATHFLRPNTINIYIGNRLHKIHGNPEAVNSCLTSKILFIESRGILVAFLLQHITCLFYPSPIPASIPRLFAERILSHTGVHREYR